MREEAAVNESKRFFYIEILYFSHFLVRVFACILGTYTNILYINRMDCSVFVRASVILVAEMAKKQKVKQQ